MKKDRLLLQLLLVSSPTLRISHVAAWSSLSAAFSTRGAKILINHDNNNFPRRTRRLSFLIPPPQTLPTGITRRGALAYQVGDTYSEDQSWDEDEVPSDVINNNIDNENDGDYSSNTFGDALLEDIDDDELEDDHHDVFQLDGVHSHFESATAVEAEGTIDLEDEDLEYSLASDYVESQDHDAAQTIFPCLDHWYVLSDPSGDEEEEDNLSIAGIVSNHPRYPCGHAVITSYLELPLLHGLSPESMVTTVTGSQYLLGTHRLELQLDDWVICDNDNADAPQITGTVSVASPTMTEQEQDSTDAEVVERLGKLLAQVGQEITIDLPQQQQQQNEINENDWQEAMTVTTALGQPYQLGSPKIVTAMDLEKLAPLLQQWKRLEGGSIAGFVEQHPTIPDGELVTTSPLVELDESHDGLVLVTTESGSQYRLGEAEPTKEQRWQQEQEQFEEDEWNDEEENFLMELEDDEEDGEEIDIPTMHVPETHDSNVDPAAVLSNLFSSFLPRIIDNSNHRQQVQPPPLKLELELEPQLTSQHNAVLNNTEGDKGRCWDPLLP